MYGMTFNGIKKDYLVVLRKKRPPWSPLERNLLELAGMPGAHNGTTKIKPRPIEATILLESKSLEDLQSMKEDLADWLVTDEPKELIFDDEPHRMYYAMVEETFDVEEYIRVGVGIVKFICVDPYKYSTSKSELTVMNPVDPVVLNNSGTAPTAPIFDITLKDKTTYLDIIGANDYMRIGKPADVEVIPVQPKEIVLWDQMSTLTGWGKAQDTDIDGGIISGNMQSSGTAFSQEDYGVGSSWHGDARIKSLGQSIMDFEVDFRIELKNPDPKMVGRVELYLLDINKQPVGKLSLKDTHQGKNGNFAELRIGDLDSGKYLISERGGTWSTWLNFNGLLRLSRVGNKWKAHVAKLVDGKYTARRTIEFIDKNNDFMLPVSSVVVHFAAHDAKPPAPMKIIDLKVYKINQVTSGQIEYIGEAGDIFTFDHKNSAVYKNGELFFKKDFGARFFPLYKGDNVLTLEPAEAIGIFDSEWRDAYK